MTILDFIFGIASVIFLFISFIIWVCAKYNLFQNNEEIEKLKLELEILNKKEERRKQREKKKRKGDASVSKKNKNK